MEPKRETINPDITFIEVHYYFNDDSHTMDAFVHNKCQLDLLAIVKRVANIFDVAIEVEIGPVDEGGLKEQFRIIIEKIDEDGTLRRDIVKFIIIGVLSWGAAELYKKLTEDKQKIQAEKTAAIRANKIQIIDSTLRSMDLEDRQEARAEKHRNDSLHKAAEEVSIQEVHTAVVNDRVIGKKRYTLMKKLVTYKKMKSYSLTGIDSAGNTIVEEVVVSMESIEDIYISNPSHLRSRQTPPTAQMSDEDRQWFDKGMPLKKAVPVPKQIEPNKDKRAE